MSFRVARVKAGKKVSEVADFLGVSEVTVWMWETGKTVPRLPRLKKLADFLGVTVDELLKE